MSDNPPDRLGGTLASTLAAACLLGGASLWAAERVKAIWLDHWGSSLGAALGAEALLAVLTIGLPTVVMGALFGHLSTRASAAGASFGQSPGVNTLGAAATPLLFGVLVTPALGPKWALRLIAAGYLALAGRQAWGRRTARTATWASAAAGLALVAWAPPLAFVELPEGGRLISYQEGAMTAVSVVQDAAGVSRLRINNRQQEGSSTSGRVDARQALLPVLLHPAPRRALLLGLGTGMTAAAAAADPTVQVDAVELLPEVMRASAQFTGASAGNPNRNPNRNPAGNPPEAQARVLVADARRFVRTSAQDYDVIVSDNFHPARSGSGSLYTVEHFQAVRGRLASGGLFCQWLPLHQMDLATLRSIVQSFLMAYPDGSALLASNSLLTPVLGLVGHSDGGHTTLTAVRQWLANAAGPRRPVDFGIEDEYALLGNFVAGPSALARFAGIAAANTDDRPVVAYIAPRITYAPDAAPGDRLVALLQRLSIDSTDLLTATPPDPAGRAAAHRLEAYWAARTQFFVAGLQVRPAASAKALLAQVRNPRLAVLRTSPDFRPAYDPLLRIASSLARSDPHAAGAVLTDFAQIQPARPEAGLALRQLGIAMRCRPQPEAESADAPLHHLARRRPGRTVRRLDHPARLRKPQRGGARPAARGVAKNQAARRRGAALRGLPELCLRAPGARSGRATGQDPARPARPGGVDHAGAARPHPPAGNHRAARQHRAGRRVCRRGVCRARCAPRQTQPRQRDEPPAPPARPRAGRAPAPETCALMRVRAAGTLHPRHADLRRVQSGGIAQPHIRSNKNI